jgi:hypothetical protein
MFGKISLEPFRPKGLAGSFVSGPDLYFQPRFLPGMP